MNHHPKSETLAACAAGALDEARTVVVAAHLALCSACRRAAHDFESLAGACLEGVEPADMRDDAMQRFWSGAGEQSSQTRLAVGGALHEFDIVAANPLARYLKGGLDNVAWRTIAPGMSHAVFDAHGYKPDVLRLLKIEPGTGIPKHTHGDEEYTLILRGAYTDEIGEFRQGDFADLDSGVSHSPMAVGDEACICLIVTNAPLVFRGLIGKVAQRFIGL